MEICAHLPRRNRTSYRKRWPSECAPRHRARLPLIHVVHFLDASTRELLRNALAMPAFNDVQTLSLTGTHRRDAIRGLIPAKLGVTDQPSRIFTEQGDHHGIEYLIRLNVLAIATVAMKLHMLGSIRYLKRCPECLFSDLRKPLGFVRALFVFKAPLPPISI